MTRQRRNREPAGGAAPRLADVARLAGVSTATVSRVLSGQAAVTDAPRRAVLLAIEQLGYVPDGAARALATRRSNTIGAVVPTIDNAIFAGCIQALQGELALTRRTLVLASSGYDAGRERHQVMSLVERGIDGLMLVGAQREPSVYTLLERKRIPYVITWVHRSAAHPCIGFDNERAGYLAARHLLDLGHREFAMLSGILDGNDRAQARVVGVRRALAEEGLELPPARLLEKRYRVADGRVAAAEILASRSAVSAIVSGNDVLALGVLFECQARGIAVPGRVSVTGIDDSELAASVTPALTSVRVPAREMGRQAAAYLLARLHDAPAAAPLELPVTLQVRGTTAAPA